MKMMIIATLGILLLHGSTTNWFAQRARILLTDFVEDGGKIYFPNSDNEYDLDSTLATLGVVPATLPHKERATIFLMRERAVEARVMCLRL